MVEGCQRSLSKLRRDCLLTDKIKFGPLGLKKQLVLNTWSGILMDEALLPDDWTNEGVLVGIQSMDNKHDRIIFRAGAPRWDYVCNGISSWTNWTGNNWLIPSNTSRCSWNASADLDPLSQMLQKTKQKRTAT
jgi:hypothetical protein